MQALDAWSETLLATEDKVSGHKQSLQVKTLMETESLTGSAITNLKQQKLLIPGMCLQYIMSTREPAACRRAHTMLHSASALNQRQG
jgi:hypothetical protein